MQPSVALVARVDAMYEEAKRAQETEMIARNNARADTRSDCSLGLLPSGGNHRGGATFPRPVHAFTVAWANACRRAGHVRLKPDPTYAVYTRTSRRTWAASSGAVGLR